MKRRTFSSLALWAVLALSGGCLSVADAREAGASRWCRFEDRCGNVGSGRKYASLADCLTDKRSDFLDMWPTDRCDGRINGQTLDVCLSTIDLMQCNNPVDILATLTKCESSDVCTAGNSGASCSRCASGQICQNGVCR